MIASETSILDSGQRVGLAVADFTTEMEDFAPLAAAEAERAELVTAIEAKEATQDTDTLAATIAKEEAREKMAVATDVLSARAVGYALDQKDMGLKQAFTLPYADVRYGDATEDVNHVRDLVANVAALPAPVRKAYRLTDAIIQAPATAADAFVEANKVQTGAKAAPHLATLDLPELLRRLSAVLLRMKTLIYGQRLDKDPNFHWADFNTAFAAANKRRKIAPKRHPKTTGPRIVRTIPFTAPTGQAQQLANTNYGLAYTLAVENRAATDMLLWMAQRDRAQTTPQRCAAGQITTLVRADIGPDTARYLMAQFEGAGGGQATVVVRKVV